MARGAMKTDGAPTVTDAAADRAEAQAQGIEWEGGGLGRGEPAPEATFVPGGARPYGGMVYLRTRPAPA
jgi:hypothetical protein